MVIFALAIDDINVRVFSFALFLERPVREELGEIRARKRPCRWSVKVNESRALTKPVLICARERIDKLGLDKCDRAR